MLKDCERRMYGKELYEIKLSVKELYAAEIFLGIPGKKITY